MSASNTKRIAKNTLMLYFRQILSMLVGLYTVRVVLETLGAEDYGIYNVVAGIVTMFSFLSGAMATASQRYFSFDLGKNDQQQLKKTFGVTLLIYLILILIIVILAETVGLWFVHTKLVVPPDKVVAARWIYQFSIISLALTVFTAPYMALIIAHEDMSIYAYVSIIEVILKLGVVFIIPFFKIDTLIIYGFLLMLAVFINTSLYRMVCKIKYPESNEKPQFDNELSKEILSYTGWNVFGASVGIFKFQAVNILLNQFFSPISDYEDAVIEVSSMKTNIDCIISRNVSDFKASRIPVYTPEQFFLL